jgi:hypothetical protein
MHTGQQRVEGHVPSPPSPPPAPVSEKAREAEFEATLGSLVEYYSTLPPGALEASVKPSQEARSTQGVRPLRKTQRIMLPQRTLLRATSWVVGGVLAMALGGVATFAIMVGPSEFLRMIEGKPAAEQPAAVQPAAAPEVRITEKQPAKEAIQPFEVRVEPIDAKGPSTGIVVEPLDEQEPVAAEDEGQGRSVDAEEERSAAKKPARRHRRAKRAARSRRPARRPAQPAAAAVAAPTTPPPAKPAAAEAPTWEDPYQ